MPREDYENALMQLHRVPYNNKITDPVTFYSNYKFRGREGAKQAVSLITSPEFGKFWTGNPMGNTSYSVYIDPFSPQNGNPNYGRPTVQPTPFYKQKRPDWVRPVDFGSDGFPEVDGGNNFIPSDYSSVPLSEAEHKYWEKWTLDKHRQNSDFKPKGPIEPVEYLDIRGALPKDERIRLAKLQGDQSLATNGGLYGQGKKYLMSGPETVQQLASNEGTGRPQTVENYLTNNKYRSYNYQGSASPTDMLITPLTNQSQVNLDLELYSNNELNRLARNHYQHGNINSSQYSIVDNGRKITLPPIPESLMPVNGFEPQRTPVLVDPRQNPPRKFGTITPVIKEFLYTKNGVKYGQYERMGYSDYLIKGPPKTSIPMQYLQKAGGVLNNVIGGLGLASLAQSTYEIGPVRTALEFGTGGFVNMGDSTLDAQRANDQYNYTHDSLNQYKQSGDYYPSSMSNDERYERMGVYQGR